MFDFELGLKEEVIVAGIAIIGFGHKKIYGYLQSLKRFITET